MNVTIAFAVGLILGIIIDKRARKDRDQRIKELEQRVKELTESSPPVRVCDESLRGCPINK
jgi:ribosomal protein L13E